MNRIKILAFDGNKYNLLALQSIFARQEYEFRSTSSSFDIPKILETWVPDYLIMDDGLHDGKVLDLIADIKGLPGMKFCSIILQVDKLNDKLVTDYLKSGVTDFIRKPVVGTYLLHKLNHHHSGKNTLTRAKDLSGKVERMSEFVKKYFSDDLVDQLTNQTGTVELRGSQQIATIMNLRVIGLDVVAENQDPKTLADFLNEMFTDLMDLIYGNSGSVNKLLADGLIATFGVPVPSEKDAFKAAKCALEIVEYLQTINDVRPKFIKQPLSVAIGLSTGKVFAGLVGSVRRLEFSVLGEAVTLADQLKAYGELRGIPVLIDDKTMNSIDSPQKSLEVALPAGARPFNVGVFQLSQLL
ncbi:MAG: hypothetical protein HUU10_12295 [Bacteroidetes bacterium]|nr:hypothetical protein [Bacteroidota bacterium]